MADKKNKEKEEKKKFPDEDKLPKLMEKVHGEFLDGMKGRPYLMVVASGYEIGKDGDKSKIAAQWSWRSNLFVNSEEAKSLMKFLISQLKDAVDHPEGGIKKKYDLD